MSLQVKFRSRRPRGRGGHGASSGASSSRKSLGAAAGERTNGRRKNTDGASDLGPAMRAAIKEKNGKGKDQEEVWTTEGEPKPPLSDSESARLFVILRFDQEIQAAFDRS